MNGENLTTAVGQQFTVRLKSTPSTGYVWEVQILPASIHLVGSEYENQAGNAPPGNPVTQAFRFQAVQAGEWTITFVLKRRWENAGIESLTVNVKIS